MLGEAFGAIAALKQESLALGNPAELALELAGLAGENQGRKPLQALFDLGKPRGIRIIRHLTQRTAAPTVRCPHARHVCLQLLAPRRGRALILCRGSFATLGRSNQVSIRPVRSYWASK